MTILKHYIIVGNRKYDYTLEPNKNRTRLVCNGADIEEKVPNEEIPQMLAQLPRIIIKIQSAASSQSEVLRFRVSSEEKMLITKRAMENGYDNMSSYIRDKLLADEGT